MPRHDDDEPFRIRELPRHVREIRRSIARSFVLLWQTSRALSIAQVALTILGGLTAGAHVVFAKRILDGVTRAIASGSAADRAQVLRWIAFEFAAVVLSSLVGRCNEVVFALLRVRLGQVVNEKILEKALTLSLADFEKPAIQDRIDRARGGASYVPLDMVRGVFIAIESTVTLVAYGAILWSVSAPMVLVITFASVAQFIVTTRFRADAFRLFHWRSQESRKQNYVESVLTRSDFAKEVKLFGLGPLLLDRYRGFFTKFWKEDRDLTIRRSVWGFALGALGTAAYYGSYGWIALKAMRRLITVGDLGMYAMIFSRGQAELSQLLFAVGGLYENHLYLGALYELLEQRSEDATIEGVTVGPTPGDGIRFENVSFAYEGSERPVLTDVSLHLPAGRKLALVGENGAGKTTLIKLLTRLYSPTSGRILLDGADVNSWNRDALRRRVGVIFQDFVRYQFTVGENIGVGDIAAIGDESRWREAAERGTASDFIDQLPKKYDTQLGKWFDDGQDLSVGQWQKIALSRAFMRTGADILILDEPTASIDAAAEARIFERFQALAADRTAVLISHRFSTVRMADIIAVLADGRILEQGSHEQLIQRGGRYAELFFLQAKGYR